jgi:nucleoside-diphosphate-sugar epimerase
VRALVTGAAGFIGSQLAASLLDGGHEVVGIDSFTPFYERWRKEANVVPLSGRSGFTLVEADLTTAFVAPVLDGVDVVFHLAAQAGVRLSWGEFFLNYTNDNVVATQRLLEAVRRCPSVRRVVFASSSSVYGDTTGSPSREDDATRPRNPYGITKLTCEHLFRVYAESWSTSSVLLRLFTVYGPGQRPDMATHRLCEAVLGRSGPFPLYGDGTARRDFTYVGDVVRSMERAAHADVAPATVVNVAGGSSTTMNDLIERVGRAAGAPVPVVTKDDQPGDVAVTSADTSRAVRRLGWAPQVGLDEGIEAQLAWHRANPMPI